MHWQSNNIRRIQIEEILNGFGKHFFLVEKPSFLQLDYDYDFFINSLVQKMIILIASTT